MKTVKAFGEYTPKQTVNGGQQWEKRYRDGETAKVMIYKNNITRRDVVNSFASQENEVAEIGVEEYRLNHG